MAPVAVVASVSHVDLHLSVSVALRLLDFDLFVQGGKRRVWEDPQKADERMRRRSKGRREEQPDSRIEREADGAVKPRAEYREVRTVAAWN